MDLRFQVCGDKTYWGAFSDTGLAFLRREIPDDEVSTGSFITENAQMSKLNYKADKEELITEQIFVRQPGTKSDMDELEHQLAPGEYLGLSEMYSTLDGSFSAAELRRIADAMDQLPVLQEVEIKRA